MSEINSQDAAMLMIPLTFPAKRSASLYNRMVAYARTLDARFIGGRLGCRRWTGLKRRSKTSRQRQAAEKKPAIRAHIELSVQQRRAEARARQNRFASGRAKAQGTC